jgi:hypothetical protein
MWKSKAVDLSNGTTTISPVGVKVRGVYINTAMSAHTCTVDNGATVMFTIPASSSAGTVITFAGEEGVIFDTSLVVTPDPAGTGDFTILYGDQK